MQARTGAARIALVEDQIKDVEHRVQSRAALLVGRHAERNARRPDRALRATDPLRHRRLGHEKGPGDLAGREAADRAQRERDRGRSRQRRVAAHEEQDQRVVLLQPLPAEARLDVGERRWGRLHDDDRFAAAARELGADVIGHPPRRHLDQPAARVVGKPLFRPLQARREQRLLDRIFRCGEIAEAPDHGAENLRRERAQQVLAGSVHQTIFIRLRGAGRS